jgi:hypothetical protein
MSWSSEDGQPEFAEGASEPRRSLRPARSEAEPPSTRFDGEDFLFHLYRGSELLQDNCVGEAKEELERALRMQPRDTEGQGLLGVVYFRLGLYPRAIEIYRDIIRQCPDEVTPKLNLALCYLKTGQPADARDLLEQVLERVPEHPRAWGYLGLSLERLNEYEKAQLAFERAGQPQLARRMQSHLDELSGAPSEPSPSREELRRAAADAVEELDAGGDDGPFERAIPDAGAAVLRSGRWRAHEPGQESLPPLSRPSLLGRLGPAVPLVVDPIETPLATAPPPQSLSLALASDPLSIEALVNARMIPSSRPGAPGRRAERTALGLVLIEVRQSLAVRGDRVRALSPGGENFKPSPLKRRARGREIDEAFGGAGASFTLLEGSGLLVLEPSPEFELVLIELSGEFVYLREARVIGFDATIRHENGRLPAADPGPVPMVQLAGEGVVVFEVRKRLGALTVRAERPLTVRAGSVLGWTGRLLGQAVAKEHSPFLGSGFVLFSGDGAVLVDDP